MASLTGQTISSTYDSLLKVTDNGPITSSLKTVTDGLGNSSSLELSTISARFGGTIVGQSSLDIAGTFYQRDDIAVLNKLQNSWLHWATRNTAGSDAVINLSNIGTLTLNSTISNGTYTYTLPSSTGTLALTSNLGSYVPYTGATSDINLGTNNSISQTITSGNGINITNSGTDNAISLINQSLGNALNISNTGSSYGISLSNSSTGFGLNVSNTGGGYGINISNAIGNGIVIDNPASVGNPFVYTKSFVTVTSLNHLGTFNTPIVTVTDEAYGASWDGSNQVPTKNALYDKIQTIVGGGGSGTVTSVASLTLGTTGTDLNSSVANSTTTPVITLNVPDASATARGVITTGTQTIAGVKTFANTIAISGGNSLQIESGTTGNYAYIQSPLGLTGGIILNLPSTGGTLALTSALSAYAPIASPTFTGTVTIPSGSSLGTPTTLVGTNISGTAPALTAGVSTSSSILITSVNATWYMPFIAANNLVANAVLYTGVKTPTINPSSGDFGITGTLTGTNGVFNGNLGINASSFTSSAFYTDLLVKSPTSADAGITVNGGAGSSYLYLSHDLTGTLPFLEIGEYNGTMQMLHYNGTQNSRPIAYNGTTKKLTFQTDGTDRITVFNTGNAFIGSSPTDAGYKLDVNGTGRFGGTLSTSAGAAINSGNGTLAIPASATRGIINIAGSTDQILTFSSQSYIYNSSSLFRILSSNDIDFVAGGSQRLFISASTGAATLTNLAGTGTRMVVSDSTGLLSTQAIPGGGGGSVDELQVALLSQVYG